jgi:hypothetical protein
MRLSQKPRFVLANRVKPSGLWRGGRKKMKEMQKITLSGNKHGTDIKPESGQWYLDRNMGIFNIGKVVVINKFIFT